MEGKWRISSTEVFGTEYHTTVFFGMTLSKRSVENIEGL
jgi:hypothetical protein